MVVMDLIPFLHMVVLSEEATAHAFQNILEELEQTADRTTYA